VGRALFVSADGMVSPCVFTNLPVREERGLYCGGGRQYERLIFGNVESMRLESIWRGNDYGAFRRALSKGAIPAECEGCSKLFIG
jgi:hypothetical protein